MIINSYMFGAGAWLPTDKTGLLHWADFDTITTLYQDSAMSTPVTADADPIGGVNDKSANNVDLSQATAGLRPPYKTGIINSKPVARFDGTGDYLSGSLAANALSAVSIYGVLRTGTASTAGTKGFWSWANNDTGSGTPFVLMQFNSGNLRVFVDGGYRFTVAVSDNTAYQYALRYDGTDWYFRLNGANQTNYTGGTTNKAGATHIFYGAGFLPYGEADFGEKFIFDSFLSGTDDTNAENYLKGEWAAY